MSKPKKPSLFFRRSSRKWYLQTPPDDKRPKGRQIDLGVTGEPIPKSRRKSPNHVATNRPLAVKEARRKWKQLKRAGHQDPKAPASGPLLVVDLIDQFLAWNKSHKAERTHEWYERHLERFKSWLLKEFNGRLAVHRLKRAHVRRWIEECYTGSGDNDRRGAVVSANRVFSWAETEAELIPSNPIRGMKRPGYKPREAFLTEVQWQQVLAATKLPALRDFFQFVYFSGARPFEATRAEGRHLDRENRCLAFPVEESKGKKHARIIPLLAAIVLLLLKLACKA